MSRLWTILSILAVAGFLCLETRPGQAQSLQGQLQAQSDVSGMDHSKLNHGVLGQVVAYVTAGERQLASANEQVRGSDTNVNGMDHSNLDHGVLGVARSAASSLDGPTRVALDLIAPAAEIVWLPPEEIRPRMRLGMNSESRPRSE
jgi:hypothetical protein